MLGFNRYVLGLGGFFCLLSIKRGTFKRHCEFCMKVLIRKHNSSIVLNQKRQKFKAQQNKTYTFQEMFVVPAH